MDCVFQLEFLNKKATSLLLNYASHLPVASQHYCPFFIVKFHSCSNDSCPGACARARRRPRRISAWRPPRRRRRDRHRRRRRRRARLIVVGEELGYAGAHGGEVSELPGAQRKPGRTCTAAPPPAPPCAGTPWPPRTSPPPPRRRRRASLAATAALAHIRWNQKIT